MKNLTDSLRSLHRHFWQINRPMTLLFWSMALLVLLGIVGIAVDSRQVLGQATWTKTTKFAISIMLYAGSMLWVFGYDTLRPRLSRFILSMSALLLGVEILLILIQGARAVPMHFNYSTPFDSTLYAIMGGSILIFWLFNALGVAVLLVQQVPSPIVRLGLRLGFIIALLGMLQGYLMTVPTADQLALLTAGQASPFIGAHTVGAVDGGSGLPFLGWSTTHGDLRIGHFVGLHGLQIIPLVGLWLTRRREAWLTTGHRLALLWIAAAGYLGVGLLVTWQALREQPLLAPDLWTTLAAIVLGGAVLAATLVILFRARQTGPILTGMGSSAR